MMALLPATAVATAAAQFPELALAPELVAVAVADGVPGRAEQAADRFGHRHGV
jgi:predicted dehydrogenase